MKKLIPIVALWAFLCAVEAYGQSLNPYVAGQFFNNSGAPLASGKICTTTTGTAANYQPTYPTFADAVALTNANTNPVVLDSAGRANIWLKAGVTYRIVIYANGTGGSCNGNTSVGTAIKTVDGVAAFGSQISGDLLPSVTNTFNIGSQAYQWKDEFLSDALIIQGTSLYEAPPSTSVRVYVANSLTRFSNNAASSGVDLEIGNPAREVTGRVLASNPSLLVSHLDGNVVDAQVGLNSTTSFISNNILTGSTFSVSNSGISAIGPSGITAPVLMSGNTDLVFKNSAGDNVFTVSNSTAYRATIDTAEFSVSSSGTVKAFRAINGASHFNSSGASASLYFDLNNGSNLGAITVTGSGIGLLYTSGFEFQAQSSAAVVRNTSSNNVWIANNTSSATDTNIWLLKNGTITNVLIGAADSCTAGYKCLRIAN